MIVANVTAIGLNHWDLHFPENAFRFKRFISERRKTSGMTVDLHVGNSYHWRSMAAFVPAAQ